MKYTYTGMKDDACYEGLEPDESWKPNVAYGYELDYHENIGALYGTYSLSDEKILGLVSTYRWKFLF